MISSIRFWSLDSIMERFYPEGFANLTGSLARLIIALDTNIDIIDFEAHKVNLRRNVEWLKDESVRLDFPVIADSADKLIRVLDSPDAPPNALIDAASYTRNVITGSLKGRWFFALEPHKVALGISDSPFGDAVAEAFPSTAWDIDEAAGCLTFDRWTAAIFHLMRVAEMATVVIGRRVGYESSKEGFGEVLHYIDNGLKKARDDYKNADPLFVEDIEFLAGISVQMHGVNRAWRQNVAHMDKKYTEEEAMRVWDATKGLMQHLSTQLNHPDEEPVA